MCIEQTLRFEKTDAKWNIILIDSQKHSPKIKDFSVELIKIAKTSDAFDIEEGTYKYIAHKEKKMGWIYKNM